MVGAEKTIPARMQNQTHRPKILRPTEQPGQQWPPEQLQLTYLSQQTVETQLDDIHFQLTEFTEQQRPKQLESFDHQTSLLDRRGQPMAGFINWTFNHAPQGSSTVGGSGHEHHQTSHTSGGMSGPINHTFGDMKLGKQNTYSFPTNSSCQSRPVLL